jgi:hypothetical protein
MYSHLITGNYRQILTAKPVFYLNAPPALWGARDLKGPLFLDFKILLEFLGPASAGIPNDDFY